MRGFRNEAVQILSQFSKNIDSAEIYCNFMNESQQQDSNRNLQQTTQSEQTFTSHPIQVTSIDGFFNRKRGRPPKNRIFEVYKKNETQQLPQAIFTSFKLEKDVPDWESGSGAVYPLPMTPDQGNQKKGSQKIKIPAEDDIGYHFFQPLKKKMKASPVIEQYNTESISNEKEIDNNETSVVRASGTFYPEYCIPEHSHEEPHDLSTPKYSKRDLISSELKNDHRQIIADNIAGMVLNASQQQNKDLTNTIAAFSMQWSAFIYSQLENFKYQQTTQKKFSQAETMISTPPIGYTKYRFSEDCCQEMCRYRLQQSHFHCNRLECPYSFCDRSRFSQHTARHERLDNLLGDDFIQHREQRPSTSDNSTQHQSNGRKISQFHCKKCDYICTDTNKVVAHRRYHSKIEYIRLSGFRRVSSNETCSERDNVLPNSGSYISPTICPYNRKHTHYHCLICNYSILSRGQLLSHRHRQVESMRCGLIQ